MARSEAQQAALDKKRAEAFDYDMIRDLSVEVYKIRLEDDSGLGAVQRMIADDKDNGEKLRSRAGFYDGAVKALLSVLRARGEWAPK